MSDNPNLREQQVFHNVKGLTVVLSLTDLFQHYHKLLNDLSPQKTGDGLKMISEIKQVLQKILITQAHSVNK